jgi:hypothetical protein
VRYLVFLGILIWNSVAGLSLGTASAASLTDIVNAGSFTTSGALTFSNFQAA